MKYLQVCLYVTVIDNILQRYNEVLDTENSITDNGKMKLKISAENLSRSQMDALTNCISGSRENYDAYLKSFIDSILSDINIDDYRVSHYTINGFDTVRIYHLQNDEIYKLELEVVE